MSWLYFDMYWKLQLHSCKSFLANVRLQTEASWSTTLHTHLWHPNMVFYPTKVHICLAKVIFTARKRSLWRLCFHRCLSVHRGGGVYPIACWDTPPQVHPPSRYNPWEGTPPWADTLPGQVYPLVRYTPSRYTPLGRHPPA